MVIYHAPGNQDSCTEWTFIKRASCSILASLHPYATGWKVRATCFLPPPRHTTHIYISKVYAIY